MTNAALSVLWAALGTLGFAILFNIRPADILIAMLGGALTWAAYRLSLDYFQLGVFSFLSASTLAGIYAETLGFFRKKPATLYSVAAVIALVPGGGMYYCLSAALRGDTAKASQLGVETLLIAGFIAGGIAVASSGANLAKHIRSSIKGVNHGR